MFRFPLPIATVIVAGLLAGCASREPVADVPASYSRPALETAYRDPVLERALTLTGTPYRYGGTTPDGMDCSGFVRYVFQESTGFRFPHNTAMIAKLSKPISRSDLKEGDFVFFDTSKPYSHMGIYIGNNEFVHAPSSRNNGQVRVDSLDSRYFAERFLDARTAFQ
ncbi:hypothetical protein CAP48_05070 [Advenella sp. S44]|uniref:C40 family peptidase n=1 Tax=Advenella sp. S44 TaxID=1982755 RepID=UPI000C2ADA35|nr:C40 family peptidase [Advenella sp. S44]PJX25426.1 hypothetical protein CAP48_05070 [Advenella sp. S44]